MYSLRPTLVAAAILAGRLVVAQDPNFDSINRPVTNEKVPVGQTYTITWTLPHSDTPTGPVTLTLIGGQSTSNLSPVVVIGNVNNDALKFDWVVDSSLGSQPFYGINITLDANNQHYQYSQPFQIVGGAAAGSSTTGEPTGTASTGSGQTSAATNTASTAAPTATTASTTSANSAASNDTATTSHSAASATSVTSTSTVAANKTTPTTKPASGDAALQAPAALGALAVALVASLAMNVWNL